MENNILKDKTLSNNPHNGGVFTKISNSYKLLIGRTLKPWADKKREEGVAVSGIMGYVPCVGGPIRAVGGLLGYDVITLRELEKWECANRVISSTARLVGGVLAAGSKATKEVYEITGGEIDMSSEINNGIILLGAGLCMSLIEDTTNHIKNKLKEKHISDDRKDNYLT